MQNLLSFSVTNGCQPVGCQVSCQLLYQTVLSGSTSPPIPTPFCLSERGSSGEKRSESHARKKAFHK